MKNHSRTNMKRGKVGYRTPSQFRFESHDKVRANQARLLEKWQKKKD